MESENRKRPYEAMLDGGDGKVVRATFPAASTEEAIEIIQAIYVLAVSPLPVPHLCCCGPAHEATALRAVK